jgi:hypothetical protein
MADLYDVEIALKNLVINAVYPNGTSSPSVANIPITIGVGWPKPIDLDEKLLDGGAYVTVYAPNGMERVVTQLPTDWQLVTINPATLTLTVNEAGTTVTVGGTVSTPHGCLIKVDSERYFYEVLSDDTLESIATALASLIPSATSVGEVISIPNAYKVTAKVGVKGTSARILERQEKQFQIITWAFNPAIRATIGAALKVYFAKVYRFTLPDQFYAMMKYSRTSEFDDYQKTQLYRRDLFYLVNYPTTETQEFYNISDIPTSIQIVSNIN